MHRLLEAIDGGRRERERLCFAEIGEPRGPSDLDMSSAMLRRATRRAACSRSSGSIMRPPRGRLMLTFGNAGWRGAPDW